MILSRIVDPFTLLLTALICYARIIPTYFLSDDFEFIGAVARQGMFSTMGSSQGGFLRPGTVLSYVIDYRLWGFNPIGYHLTNVVWHTAAAYALYLLGFAILRGVDTRHRRVLSFLAACLFVALPCHSESVSWVAGRTDVIAVALGLGSTVAFLYLLQNTSFTSSACALMLLAGALLTKEAVVSLPPIWLILSAHQWWTSRIRPSNQSLITLALAFLLLLVYFLLRKVTLGHFIGGYGTQYHISILHSSTIVNLVYYAARTFLPALPLSFFVVGSWFVILGAGFLIACIATMLFLSLKVHNPLPRYLLPMIVLCYLASLVPVATMRVALFDTQGERFLYLPSAFACIGAVVLLDILFKRPARCFTILGFLVIIQALTLQWVNNRWITASILSRQIAAEVSAHDPWDTVVLNIPDNYRGAYVFRNGLQEAATLFVGNGVRGQYRQVCTHSLDSLQQEVNIDVTPINLIVTLPNTLRFYEIYAGSYDIRHDASSLHISAVNTLPAEERKKVRFLSFKNGIDRPMLRTIVWDRQNALHD